MSTLSTSQSTQYKPRSVRCIRASRSADAVALFLIDQKTARTQALHCLPGLSLSASASPCATCFNGDDDRVALIPYERASVSRQTAPWEERKRGNPHGFYLAAMRFCGRNLFGGDHDQRRLRAHPTNVMPQSRTRCITQLRR